MRDLTQAQSTTRCATIIAIKAMPIASWSQTRT